MPIPPGSTPGRAAWTFGPLGRFVLALTLTVSAWALLVGLAVVIFSGQVVRNQHDLVQGEVFGFACGFTVAGTIAGFVALAALGEWRRALGFVAMGSILLGASMFALRWQVFRLAGLNVGWGQRSWDDALERIGPSLAVGAAIALVVSALVLASGLLARRMAPWKFGLVVVVAVYVLGLWGFPLMISHLTERALPYLRWHYGYRYDQALQGAAIGAGPGALTGAIVVSLMARWLGTLTPARRLDRSPSHEGM